ncbi:DUF1700 domain-containing protein [Filobacillus milosensis]|uniref:DUF1700 domain-containing protein n=1 Tax=Filobacillus milosensis TaxID=94137 RepID=A0A4Y8IF88_9BACI|nr:DUF1700 domain-containing protein [Filobacillus milosensis]TFB18865.1 DUF1700 domain-containing protein [Filobacillus milosensis]
MNKEQYLKELKQLLSPLTKEERDEILYDYREHFDNGMRDGKTELEIINELGLPNEVAENMLEELPDAEQQPKKSNTDYARMIVLAIVLIFVNCIFVLAPVVAIIGAYISLYSVVFTFIFSPFVFLYHSLVNDVGSVIASLFTLGMGISAGVLVFLALLWIGKWIYRIIRMYINFNIKLVRGY